MNCFFLYKGDDMTSNKVIAILLFASLFATGQVAAAGLLTPANSSLPELEIKEHHVNVMIMDGYVTTEVEQVFHNPHQQSLDALYSFPVPSKAAVSEFTYWIDGVPVTGEVVEQQQAQEIYQQERAAGREVAVVEQDSFQSFDISVAAVPPLDEVRIRLVYLQPAFTDAGIGRYLYPLEDGGVDEEKLEFWSRSETVSEVFSFKLLLRSSYPIDGLRLPNHQNAVISQLSPQEWQVSLINRAAASVPVVNDDGIEISRSAELDQTAAAGATVIPLDQDIVAYWRHADGLPGALDMVAYKTDPQQRGTFMMTLTPGDDLGLLSQGRDWVFVVDISGSMQGKFSTLIEGMNQSFDKLQAADRYKVILFNNTAHELASDYRLATSENIAATIGQLDNISPEGGTNLYAGLTQGLRSLDSDRSSGIILVTDGVANVGVTEKSAFLELLEQKDVRLFTFIMGNSANRPLLESMTAVSNGFYQEISNSDDIMGQLMLAMEKVNKESFRDVEVQINGVRVSDMTPGTIGTLYSGQQLQLFGHYFDGGSADIRITGGIGSEEKTYETTIEFPVSSVAHPELERLWAFAAINEMQNRLDYFGEDSDAEQAITDLALENSLVTEYTSMIAMTEEAFVARGIDRRNRDRVEIERDARDQRLTAGVQNNRVDTARPLYTSNRASAGSSGGAGALGPWVLLLLGLPLLQSLRRAK